MKVGILGTGSYLPEKILTNDDLSKIVDTNDEWIQTRTGIKERRIAADDQATSDLAYEAALKAIEDAGIDKNEIDLVIVATSTPDYSMPSSAALVQDKLGIKASGFDLEAACTGFVYGLVTGYSFIKAGVYKKVLVNCLNTTYAVTHKYVYNSANILVTKNINNIIWKSSDLDFSPVCN